MNPNDYAFYSMLLIVWNTRESNAMRKLVSCKDYEKIIRKGNSDNENESVKTLLEQHAGQRQAKMLIRPDQNRANTSNDTADKTLSTKVPGQ